MEAQNIDATAERESPFLKVTTFLLSPSKVIGSSTRTSRPPPTSVSLF